MSRLRKVQALEMIESLLEVNSFFINSWQNMNIDLKVELVNNAIDCCYSLDDYLHYTSSENSNVYIVFQKYADILSGIAESVEESTDISKLLKLSNKTLLNFKSEFITQITDDKKQVLFLPYNSSMWDSFESVWKEFSKDDNFDVIVMPIPYFDKKHDGSIDKMYYEIDKFPSYVSLTSYNEFDIEKEKPDIIFVHNPYDQYNIITSVAPMYYSSELKKHTKNLIYIPYFTSINNVVEKHMFSHMSMANFDKIIVDKESAREICISALKEQATLLSNENIFGNLEEKVVALGSPKLDKITSIDNSENRIPVEWEKFTLKSDGTKKRVIFYNTSIANLLSKKEDLLKMYVKVFNFFSNSENCVLLWRPHPLLESTLKSMLPNLFELYIKIKNFYLTNEIGIYDDSSDLHRAINIADIYYGDNSSVVELFSNLNKPILIQNQIENFFDNKLSETNLFGMSEFNNKIYSNLTNINCSVQFDLDTLKFNLFDSIPGFIFSTKMSFKKIDKFNNKYYYIPYKAKEIVVYDIERKEYTKIELNINENLISADGLFNTSLIYNDKLYLFPLNYREIICIDLKTNNVFKRINLIDDIPLEKNMYLFSQFEFIDDKTIALPIACGNGIVIFNLETYSYRLKRFEGIDFSLQIALKNERDFWFVANNEFKFLKWNLDTDEITTFEYESEKTASNYYFNIDATCIFEEWIYCFPAFFNLPIKINTNTGEYKLIEELMSFCQDERLESNKAVFSSSVVVNNCAYLQYQLDNLIIKYELETKKITIIKKEFSNTKESYWQIFKSYFDNVEENIKVDLTNKNIEKVNLQSEIAGVKIYEYILKNLN